MGKLKEISIDTWKGLRSFRLQIPKKMLGMMKTKNFLWKFNLRCGVITTAIVDLIYSIFLFFDGQWFLGLLTFMMSILLGLSTIGLLKVYRVKMIYSWLLIAGIYLFFSPYVFLGLAIWNEWLVADSDSHTIWQFFQHLAFVVFSWCLHIYFFRVVYSFYRYNKNRFVN